MTWAVLGLLNLAMAVIHATVIVKSRNVWRWVSCGLFAYNTVLAGLCVRFLWKSRKAEK